MSLLLSLLHLLLFLLSPAPAALVVLLLSLHDRRLEPPQRLADGLVALPLQSQLGAAKLLREWHLERQTERLLLPLLGEADVDHALKRGVFDVHPSHRRRTHPADPVATLCTSRADSRGPDDAGCDSGGDRQDATTG